MGKPTRSPITEKPTRAPKFPTERPTKWPTERPTRDPVTARPIRAPRFQHNGDGENEGLMRRLLSEESEDDMYYLDEDLYSDAAEDNEMEELLTAHNIRS